MDDNKKQRTTIYLDGKEHMMLKHRSIELKVSMSEIVGELIHKYLVEAVQQ